MSSNESTPGLVSGHAKLATGTVQEALGYTEQGQANKQDGKDELKKYSEQNPPSDKGGSTLGKVEASIGSAVGCDGLEKGGDAKQ